MSWLFASGGQSTGALASVLPVNIQGWFSLGWTGWISLQSKGLSKVFSRTTIWKHQFFSTQLCLWPNSHIHTWLVVSGKTIVLIIRTFVRKVISLLSNMLSSFATAFLPKSKLLLILWLQSPSTVIFTAQEHKICHCFHFFPFYLSWEKSSKER